MGFPVVQWVAFLASMNILDARGRHGQSWTGDGRETGFLSGRKVSGSDVFLIGRAISRSACLHMYLHCIYICSPRPGR